MSIQDFKFEPQALTVKVGTEVAWRNNGQAPHTVKWADDTPESDRLSNGDRYTRTFATAGTFEYVCGIHSNMTGSVIVE